MHVLFLADGLFPFVVGGMQKHSTMLIKHLSPLVDQITVCTCGEINALPPSKEDILEELVTSKDNIQVLTCTFEDRGKYPGHYLRASRKLSRTFLNLAGNLYQYDCIYAQGLTGDAFLEKHPRVLVNLHGLEMFQPAYSLKEFFAKRLIRPTFKRQISQSWKVVSLGGRLSDMLKANGARDEQVVVLPNGVDEFWFDSPIAPKTDDQIRFLMVGRNEYRKGFHVLREALSMLNETIELHLVGDWPKIESTHHNVLYHGVVRDKRKLMKVVDSCDVLLLPSLSEGMPTVVLEAKARGLHVIATDVGAMSDIQDDLISPNDYKELAIRVSEFEENPVNPILSADFKWSQIAAKTLFECSQVKSL